MFYGDPQKTVRLGNGGIIAAAVAWAAFAPTVMRAALRPVLALCVFPVLLAAGLYGAWWVFDHLADALSSDEELQPIGEMYGLSFGVPATAVPLFALVVPALMLSGAAAWLSGATTRLVRRRAFSAGALALVLFDGVSSLGEGAEVAAILALVSAAWLLWALRRAGSRPDKGHEPAQDQGA